MYLLMCSISYSSVAHLIHDTLKAHSMLNVLFGEIIILGNMFSISRLSFSDINTVYQCLNLDLQAPTHLHATKNVHGYVTCKTRSKLGHILQNHKSFFYYSS